MNLLKFMEQETRDFTYISDVINASLLALRKGDGQAYNIGSGNRVSVKELANKIITITKSKSEIIYTQPQKGDTEHTWANVEKAKNELGWNPTIRIDERLALYIDWWKKESRGI